MADAMHIDKLYEELATEGSAQFRIKRVLDTAEPRVDAIMKEHRREARERALSPSLTM